VTNEKQNDEECDEADSENNFDADIVEQRNAASVFASAFAAVKFRPSFAGVGFRGRSDSAPSGCSSASGHL